ncbi:MAG: cellulase family glycosylhydrolase [Ignavibacteriales bacterium]|nr:cellulase family glycosylhydrolase [Ignavibacteriales bacterium]
MNVRSCAIFLLLCIVLGSATVSAQGFLGVSGTKIVNGRGEEFILRGIGLGGWLVPEGYMLQTSSFANSPTEIRNKIVGMVGAANADTFYALYRKSYVARKDIEQIAKWGFNSIRLPMHYALLTPKNQPGVYLESGFALIDSLLSWCEANRLYLILDLHCAPGGQNSANISDYISGEPSLWESVDNQNQTIALWKKIAERYAAKEWIGGYDLLNETVWTFGAMLPPLKNLRDLSIAITSAIRQVDTTHIVFIEGNSWATDFSGLTPAWDAKMAYSFHKYWNSNDYNSIAYLISLRTNSNRPLWLGESGENSNQWFEECITLMEANKIGWAWWPHKKIGSIAGPLSATLIPEYNTLLSYWKGQTTRPTLTFALNALLDQAGMLAYDKCRFQPDVIDAIIRQPNSTETLPYANNSIPGYIYAVNYDMGKMPFAYKDNDYQQIPQGTAYNSGWVYRNDGVDIESCSDAPTNGYDVGWIGDGEYLRFTVNVLHAGSYSANIRVASQSGGGQVMMQVDDTISFGGVVSVPLTGGWQTWGTVFLGIHDLAPGTHKLRIIFVKGGFNLNHMQFSRFDGVADGETSQPNTFGVRQNYPNPFNPSTRIAYSLPSSGSVSLEVMDVLGRRVRTIEQGFQAEGEHFAEFDARSAGLSSGVYYYRVNYSGHYSKTMKAVLIQ